MLFYQLYISIYPFFIRLAAIFGNSKAKLWITGRRDWRQILKADLREHSGKLVWFHCASLGEFEQAKPIIEKIKESTTKVLVTFFSPSGYEQKRNDSLIDYVYYLPVDTRENAKELVQIINPSIFVLIKYEFWFNLLNELNSKNVPTFAVASTFREGQYLFGMFGKTFLHRLQKLEGIFTQEKESNDLLIRYGFTNTENLGDTRFDRVDTRTRSVVSNRVIEQFKKDDILIVVGSSWNWEENLAARFISNESMNVKWLFAPHDISSERLTELERLFPEAIRFTADFDENNASKIMILDTIGMLANAYQYADIAVVGGGNKNKLHNILEPATFGVPVLFGDNNAKFWEAKAMVNEGGAIEFNNDTSFKGSIKPLILNAQKRKTLGQQSKRFIQNNRGATDRIYSRISKFL